MPDEKRMIENYEVKTAIHIGGMELIFAEDSKEENLFMVCECTWDNPLGIQEYKSAVAGDSYVEMMTEFVSRLSEQVQRLDAERARRGISHTPLTEDDCIPGSRHQDFTNQFIIIKPQSMAAHARTADHQLFLAHSGNGCRPEARGNAVFCDNLYTGKTSRWERYEVAGVIRPDRMPEWAKTKLAEREAQIQPDKTSLREKLNQAKQTAAEANVGPRASHKNDPAL